MPWTFDPVTRGDEIVAAVHQLIADGGVAAVTYRSVGAIVGLSASSIHDNDPQRAEAVHCLLEGLESARTTGDEPMSYDRASEVLEVVLTALRSVPAVALAVAPGSAR